MYKEFYYLMYCRLLKIKTNDMPAFNAYLLVSMLMCFSVLTIIVILCYFSDISIRSDINIDATYIGFILAIGISLLNYFTLFSKQKVIFEKYQNKYQEAKSKRKIIFGIYEALSYVAFFAACVNLIKWVN